MPFEKSFETGRISVMKGSRRVLVKVVLFQLRGRGHPQDDATPNFCADSYLLLASGAVKLVRNMPLAPSFFIVIQSFLNCPHLSQ